MKYFLSRPLALLLASMLCGAGALAQPTAAASAASDETPTASPDARTPDWDRRDPPGDAADDEPIDRGRHGWRSRHHWHHRGHDVVNIGDDSKLEIGQRADSVVSVFGNTQVSGTAEDSAVAVFGDTYVDGKIGGDAVAVFGNVELGPHAEIGGDVVAIAGKVLRDPAAIVHGESNTVFGGHFGRGYWMTNWIEHCLSYGRLLSFTQGLGWAWGLALAFLALYICLALVFRDGITRCVETFENHPGHSLLAALIAMLLTPVLIVLLCITVIGIAAVPLVVMALFCAALFGKAVMLAWVGRRVVGKPGAGTSGHPAVAVLVGGLLVLVLYLVPVLGVVAYKLLGFLGLGAVVYSLILAVQARQTATRRVSADGSPGATGATMAGAKTAGMAGATGATMAGATMAGMVGATTPPPSDPAATSQSTAPLEGARPSAAVPPGATQPASAAPAPAVSAGLPRAGFWLRMAALLLDVLLVGFVTSVLHSIFHLHLVLLAAYGAIMWKLRGSTIGGLVFDLRVVRLDGREIDWETAIIRALSCFLSLAVAGLGFFWIAFDDAKQAWHDKIAGTVVVRVPKARPLV